VTEAAATGPAERLQAALEELERRLRDFEAPIIGHLRPGTSRETVEAVLARYGFAAPAELRALWGWHDGTDTRDYAPTQLLGGWHLMSVEEAAREHEFQRGISGELADFPEGYPDTWFPVLHFEGGPFLAADCTLVDTEAVSPLYMVDPHADLPEDPPRPDFPSLGHLIEAFIRLFDLGLVEFDETRGGPTVRWERLPADLRQTGYW